MPRNDNGSRRTSPNVAEDDQVDLVRLELEAVAKARNIAQIDLTTLPVLKMMADVTNADDLLSFVESTIYQLGPSKAKAASYLLANTESRWTRTYRARSTDAATELKIGSYNTFRDRKTADGLSHHDRLLRDLAMVIVARNRPAVEEGEDPDRFDVDDRPGDDAAPAAFEAEPDSTPKPEVDSDEPDTQESTRIAPLAVIVGAVLIVLASRGIIKWRATIPGFWVWSVAAATPGPMGQRHPAPSRVSSSRP